MLETPSGKNAATENFPVASWLIDKALRPHVMCFYNFARAIDDIADNPELMPDDKITRLEAFGDAVSHGSEIKALKTANMLCHSLKETNVTPQHCLDLITAFKQDAVKSRYQNWQELMQYCRYSAAPVGRYLLDLHGEDKALYPASDALCSALQVINHLQDMREDYIDMDRVYVPYDWLSAQNLEVDDLNKDITSPALRRIINQMLEQTDILLQHSAALASAMQDRHLRAETRIIQNIALALTKRLYRQDPLARRVKLSKLTMGTVATRALLKL